MMWDIKLSKAGDQERGYPIFAVNIPSVISRAMKDKGYDRVTLEVTEQGILLRPYISNGENSRNPLPVVELPEWK